MLFSHSINKYKGSAIARNWYMRSVNKPSLPRSLISAFAVRYLNSSSVHILISTVLRVSVAADYPDRLILVYLVGYSGDRIY